VLVECRCNASFGDAKESLVQLLNVNVEERQTALV